MKIPLASLPDLPEIPKAGPVTPGSPVSVYTRIARHIRACWFSPRHRKLKGYIFFAQTSFNQKPGYANIRISKKTRKGRRGLKAFEVTFQAVDKGTFVSAKNFNLPPLLGSQMEADVRNWANGRRSCLINKSGQTAALYINLEHLRSRTHKCG